MEALKQKWSNFTEEVKGFFKPDGQWNRQVIVAVLIAGFIGWLLITVSFGAKLKSTLKKVPGIKMIFGKSKRTYSRAARGASRYKAPVRRAAVKRR